MTYEWPMMPPDEQCPVCNYRCIHGICDCSGEMCADCWRKWNLEQEAELEANFQINVMGPALGFESLDAANERAAAITAAPPVLDGGDHVHDWRGIDTGWMCAICCKTETL